MEKKKKKKESAFQCKGQGFDPWSGNEDLTPEQLSWALEFQSPCATTAKPEHPN